MKDRRSLYFYLLLSACSFLYVLARAINVGITYDEAWTLNDFVPLSFMHIVNYTPCGTNNHILNTLLIKLLYSTGYQTVFIARLPNVLSFILFLFFTYKIASRFLSARLGIITFLLLVLNPFLLDFFGLARGYGIAISCQLASIYYLILFFKEPAGSRYVLPSMIWAAVAVLANFSLFNFYTAVVGFISIYILFFQKENLRRNIYYGFLVTAILTLILWEPVRKMNGNGSLYIYGGKAGFYQDTLTSLAKYIFYSPEISRTATIALNVFLIVFFAVVVSSFIYKQKQGNLKIVLISLLFLSISSVILQHYLLGSLYPIDRAALLFYPMFILALCFSIDSFEQPRYSQILSLPVLLLFGLNFFIHANLYKTAIWFYDAHSCEILNKLNSEGRKNNKKLKIDFSWPFRSSAGYYMSKYNYPFIEIVKNENDREELNIDFDYYLYLDRSLEQVGYNAEEQKILPHKKDTVEFYKKEGVYVFKKSE